MLVSSALAPDGSPVDGFEFDGRTVRYRGDEPVDAGIRVALDVRPGDDPQWLVPGIFYGENRAADSTCLYPRFTPGHVDVARMESDSWSFRADRCATPAVFARGAGLITSETSPLGQSGVGFAYRDGRPQIWLDFPYREEPLRYDGSETPQPPDIQTHRWQPGESVELEFRQSDGDWRREVTRPRESPSDSAWVSVAEAAELAAWGLYRWHFRDDPPRLVETVEFDGEVERDAMHVSWVSGVPYAYALLRHGKRVGNDDYVRAAEAVLDHTAANLAPGGTFWPQWTRDRGWTWGWHPDHDRAHARTLADAALFMLRSGGRWEAAARSNVTAALRTQREDGALPSAHSLATGDAVSWDGTAGMSWIPPLVEAGHAEEARRAGAYYSQLDTWYGAPEDVDLAPSSEDGYAAVMAFVAVEDWVSARRAADWTLTFRYTYDVDFDPDTVLGRYAFKTHGADNASPPNQHLHAFGLICLPELMRLGEPYRASALQNLDCFRQFIARKDGDFGARRGMAAERYLQTDCFGHKGTLLPLSHAWSIGVLLYACEEVLS
ncbi:MAG: hypothetical protein ACJ74N_05120 [Gaiellaceae bacterium]